MIKVFFRDESGFSLIECAIVLTIIGVLTSLTLPMILNHQEKQRHQLTKERQKKIVESIEGYFIKNKSLPVPWSHPYSQQSVKKFEGISIGYFPYQEVGLTESETQDGFGRPMIYAVDQPFQEKLNKLPSEGQEIILEDGQGERILKPSSLSKDEPDKIAFIILSLGPRLSPEDQEHPDEKKNKDQLEQFSSQKPLIFIYRPYSQDPQTPFRQRLVWGSNTKLKGMWYGSDILKNQVLFEKLLELQAKDEIKNAQAKAEEIAKQRNLDEAFPAPPNISNSSNKQLEIYKGPSYGNDDEENKLVSETPTNFTKPK